MNYWGRVGSLPRCPKPPHTSYSVPDLLLILSSYCCCCRFYQGIVKWGGGGPLVIPNSVCKISHKQQLDSSTLWCGHLALNGSHSSSNPLLTFLADWQTPRFLCTFTVPRLPCAPYSSFLHTCPPEQILTFSLTQLSISFLSSLSPFLCSTSFFLFPSCFTTN